MRRFVVLLCVAVSAQGQVCNGGPTNVPAGATAANFANCNALSNGATCNPVTGYGCSTGYTPDALAAFVLACPAGTYDASAARCTANSCVGGLDTPTGAQVSNTVPTTITTGNDLSAFVTPQTGYSCAGSRNAVCTTGGNNRATVATYVCTGLLCSSVGSVTGATTLTAGSVRTGDALTMQQQNGYRCTGTAIAQCMTVNSVAGIVGYTCGPAECTGGITAPTGASVTGTPPAVIKNGDDISVYLQAQAGYSCLGNPQARAVCTTSGITAVSVTAYTCTALSCASLSAPTGTAVIVQRATATNTDVTANLQVQTGYSCSGTALAMCNTANGVASVTGYSCSTLACASFQAPTGAQIVTQQGVNHNQVLTGLLQSAQGYTCSGTPRAVCGTANGAAGVSGYACVPIQCQTFNVPNGADIVAQRASSTGDDLSASISPTAGYTCQGTPRALCTVANGAAGVTGYTCQVNQCQSIGALVGATITTQGPATTGDNLSGRLTPAATSQCTGTPVAVCNTVNGAASVTGYTCSRNRCSSITAPPGATVTLQRAVDNGEIVTANLQSSAGYACTGVATAVCSAQNGAASVTGYTCTQLVCATIGVPTNGRVTQQRTSSTGDNLSPNVGPLPGYTCTGTPISSCSAQNGVALVTGYTCAATTCSSFAVPTGAQATAQTAVSTGQTINANLQAQNGYTCSGTATVFCPTVNNVATVSGYTCVATFQCSSFNAPAGAQVTNPGGVNDGQVVTGRLSAQNGYTCSGTAVTSCPVGGGAASVTGYTCSAQCNSLSAPPGSTVTAQGATTGGQVVTGRLTAQQGYTCSGTATAVCTQVGGTASVSGYTCIATTSCASLAAPPGSNVVTQGATTNGANVLARLAAQPGYSCAGQASASCMQVGGVATVTGTYTCTLQVMCAAITAPTWAVVTTQGGVNNNQDVTAWLAPQQGYTCTGTARTVCTQQGATASVTGYTCVLAALQCSTLTSPTGAQVTTQGAVTHGQDVTGRLSPAGGYVCTGTATAVCNQANGAASTTGYSCTAMQCASFSSPNGAQVTSQGSVTHTQDVTTRLTALQGYTCSGTGRAQCTQQGGVASVTGYTCNLISMCASFTAPPGAQATTQGGVNNNQDITAWLTAQQGYTCTGTARTVCTQQGGTASVTGYTCSLTNMCTAFTAPPGAQATTQGGVNNNQDITAWLTAQQGYTCTGTARTVCTQQGGTASVTGYTCSLTKMCTAFTAPPGAQVTTQGGVNNNQDVTAWLTPQQGYTCTGTAMTVCTQQGATASVTGYTCALIQCSSLRAPAGAQVTTQGSVSNNQDVTGRLSTLPGYVCTGTATSLCTAQNAVATITGFSCTTVQCASFAAPPGAQVTSQGSVNNNQDLTGRLSPLQGYTCTGTATATCLQQGGTASVTGYTCTTTSLCSAFTPPVGSVATTQGGVNNNQDITAWLTAQQGYTCSGTASTVCTQQGGTAGVTGYTCTLTTMCASFTAPIGSQVTTQGGVNNNQDITAWLTPQQGYTCAGTARTVCTQQGGTASVTGYTCTTGTLCSAFTPPVGSVATTQGGVNNNQDITAWLAPQQGYTCSGTASTVCTQQGGTAVVTGYTCTLTAMCASFTAPIGSQVTTQGGVNNNQDITAWLAPQQGYTCTGTARTVCTQQGGTASVTGYTCTTGTLCSAFTPPVGSVATTQGGVNNNQDITAWLAPQQGYTCTGTARTVCTQQGGTAGVTGYTCTLTAMCASFTAPIGSQVTTQGGVNNNQDITAWLAPQQGYTCTGTARTVCTQQGATASVTGYTCTTGTTQCVTLTAPPGAQVTASGNVNHNQDVSTRVSPQQGYTCSGTAIAVCTQQGGSASTSGYTCTLTAMCASFTAPMGAQVTTPAGVNNNQDVTAWLAPQQGYTCTGTARTVCTQQGATASVTGYTCTTGVTQCNTLTAPTGAQVTASGSVNNGQDVTGRIAPQQGYTCTGTATAMCTQQGGTASTSGYTCTLTAMCASFTTPAGAQVTTQGGVNSNQDITAWLAPQQGYTCTGTAMTVCTQQGGIASVTGYSCTFTTLLCNTLTAPPGAQVTTQGGVNNNQDVTVRLSPMAGYTCTGTARALCTQQGGIASTTGYVCTSSSGGCTGFTAPVGSLVTSLGPVTNGQDVTARLTPQSGYTCSGVARAECVQAGSIASVRGYTCSLTGSTGQCASFAPPAGAQVTSQGSVTGGQDVTARITALGGYVCSGTAVVQCTQGGGVGTVTGYVCIAQCQSLSPPSGAQVATQGAVVNGEDVTGRLAAQSGYVCVGTGAGQCGEAGGVATVTGFSCSPALGCSTLTAPPGAVVVTQGQVLDGQDVTSLLQASAGSVCSGTARASCGVANGGATVQGYTCSASGAACTGGLEVPSGAARTSANLPAQLTTGADVSAYVQPAPGYACVGAAVAVCPAAGSSAVAVTGYTCGRSTRTCAGITAIAGTTVTSQGAVGDGADVGNRVGSAPGYTCTGSATAVCAQEGAQAALAGYYCTAYVCSSLVAPVGAAVTTQGTVVNGEAVSGRLGSQPGYTCTGNAVAQCVTAGGAATVSGYTCVLGGGNGAVCTGGVIVPAGSSLSSALPASIATGTDLTSYFVPQDGFVCVNRAVASCPVSGSGKADVTQFTCVDIPSGCTTPASYPGYAIGQGQRTIQCAAGYAGAVSITCPSGGGQMVLSGCTPSSPGGNVCALPASTNGYAIAGGSSCTTVGACGTVTCLPGYRTVGTPRVWCVANGGAFTLTGCAPDGTPVCSAPALPGYVVGACTVGVTCTNVQCASGYSSVATAPRVVCGSDGGVLVGEGCVQSSAVASLPTRPWKRVRMSVVPQWPLLSTEQMSSFITSLEQKLALSYYRFERSLAELRITLMCPADVTPTDQTCYRPKVEWRPYSTVQQTTAQPPQIIDIIVADDTHELVDEDIRNLKLQVDNAVKGTGPIATGRPDLPLVVDPTRAFSTSVPDQLGLVTAPSGGTPILTLSPNTDDDDDSFPWWAILLITLAALLLLLLFILLLCCCCGKKKSAADTRATEKEKEHRGYYDDENHSPENPLDAMYATPSKPKSLDSYDDQNSSAAEAIRARQLREEIYVLEKQRNALESQPPPSRTSSIVEVEEVEYIDASSPPRALTHRWLLGDEVEVLYAGQWYPATIASSGPDPYGAWDVDWGDGTGSRFVAASDIRPPGGWSEYTTVVY